MFRSILTKMRLLLHGIAFAVTIAGPAVAGAQEQTTTTEPAATGGQSYIIGYALMILGLALGLLVVCRPAARQKLLAKNRPAKK